jgi:hypothetical protein
VSLGKLYDEILPIQNSKVWKSEGPGDAHRFTDEDNYSIRVEVTPIKGLNVGFQFFLPSGQETGFRIDGRDAVSGLFAKDVGETGAWKEIGVGASYTSDLLNAQLGVRFDSNVDRFGSLDTGPSGNGSYLHHYYGMAALMAGNVPAIAVAMAPTLQSPDGWFIPRYKHMDKIVSVDYTNPSAPTAEYLPYDGGIYAFFGFNLKGVKNLSVTAHGGLYNLGAFNEFGYGRCSEFVKYNNIVPGLGAGITMQQEFYGSDVWNAGKVNSPFLQFTPQVSYVFMNMKYAPIPMLTGTLDATIGISPDVLDIYVKVKPNMTFSLGIFLIDLFYEMEYTGYTAGTGIKPITTHTVGLGGMLLF